MAQILKLKKKNQKRNENANILDITSHIPKTLPSNIFLCRWSTINIHPATLQHLKLSLNWLFDFEFVLKLLDLFFVFFVNTFLMPFVLSQYNFVFKVFLEHNAYENYITFKTKHILKDIKSFCINCWQLITHVINIYNHFTLITIFSLIQDEQRKYYLFAVQKKENIPFIISFWYI